MVRVCRDAFWYKDDVKEVFVAAGTPVPVWDRHSSDDISKAKTARAVLGELVAVGQAGNNIQCALSKNCAVWTGATPMRRTRRRDERLWPTYVERLRRQRCS